MSDSVNPAKDLRGGSEFEGCNDKVQTTLFQFLESQSNQSPVAVVEQIIKIAQDYVKECSNHPEFHQENPTTGAESFFWCLWEALLRAIGNWNSDQEYEENLDRAIGFVKALQAQSEDRFKCTIWGQDQSINKLPFLSHVMQDANNGPFVHSGPKIHTLGSTSVQNALAGAPVIPTNADENVEIVLKCRKGWLGLQGLLARLCAEVSNSYAECIFWAVSEGLEKWPRKPPSIVDADLLSDQRVENTAAYRALMVEGAAVGLRLAAPQMYAQTEIPVTNMDKKWKIKQDKPGRRGPRWIGPSGMDKEKRRWGLWKDVLKEIMDWYDKEAAAGRGRGWRVKDATIAALQAMEAAELG